MKIQWQHLLCSGVLFFSSQALAQPAQTSELDALRAEIRQMRSDYEARIADLEDRLDAAEKKRLQTRQPPRLQDERTRLRSSAPPPRCPSRATVRSTRRSVLLSRGKPGHTQRIPKIT